MNFVYSQPDTVRIGTAVETQVQPWQERQPRNPMQPVMTTSVMAIDEEALVNLVLDSILISNTRRIAFINGTAYQTGEDKQGVHVLKILSNSVIVMHEQERKHLQIVKTTVNR